MAKNKGKIKLSFGSCEMLEAIKPIGPFFIAIGATLITFAVFESMLGNPSIILGLGAGIGSFAGSWKLISMIKLALL